MMSKKSHFVGFLLTLIVGPLGLFYSSALAAIIFIVGIVGAAFVLQGDPQAASAAGTGVWILSIITNFFTVSAHNKKVDMMWMMRR
jgi:hypothetical protein